MAHTPQYVGVQKQTYRSALMAFLRYASVMVTSLLCGCSGGAVVGWTIFLVIVFWAIGKLFGKQADQQFQDEYDDDSDDGYETSSGLRLVITSSWEQEADAQAGEFVISDKPIRFGEFTIPRPAFYVGRIPDGSYPDASVIDPSLKVASAIHCHVPEMDYWPSYSNISPTQRRMYLEWLAGGRSDTNVPAGYIFIFFYGLERRVLIDKQNFREVAWEIRRLREIYQESGSFNSYSARLLGFINLRRLKELREDELVDAFPSKTVKYYDDDSLSAVLAWYLLHHKPLSPRWALEIARRDPRSPSSVVVTRVKDEFEKLFQTRHEEAFGVGQILKSAKRPTAYKYNPASATVSSYRRRGEGVDEDFRVILPNALGLSSQFTPLVKVYSTCVEDLRSFSRSKAKQLRDDPITVEAWEKLPPELRDKFDHPEQSAWTGLLGKSMGEGSLALVPAGELAVVKDFEWRRRLTVSQSIQIVETGGYLGYALEPDPRLTRSGWDWESKVAVYHESHPDEHLQASSPFRAASILMHLGLSIAAADGEASPEELETITEFLDSQFMLTPAANRRLKIFGTILLQEKIRLGGLGKRIQSHLDEDQRSKVGRFLVAIAAADGVFYKEEISALRKAYKALGINPEQAVADVEQITAEGQVRTAEPVVVRRGKEAEAGEKIPRPHEQEMPASEPIRLDRHAIAKILEDTKEVASILGDVLSDEENVIDSHDTPDRGQKRQHMPVDSEVQNNSHTDSFHGLDRRYHAFLKELLSKNQWTKAELRVLCVQYGLMLEGAIETINEWADDALGDFLLDGEGPFSVRTELLDEKGAVP